MFKEINCSEIHGRMEWDNLPLQRSWFWWKARRGKTAGKTTIHEEINTSALSLALERFFTKCKSTTCIVTIWMVPDPTILLPCRNFVVYGIWIWNHESDLLFFAIFRVSVPRPSRSPQGPLLKNTTHVLLWTFTQTSASSMMLPSFLPSASATRSPVTPHTWCAVLPRDPSAVFLWSCKRKNANDDLTLFLRSLLWNKKQFKLTLTHVICLKIWALMDWRELPLAKHAIRLLFTTKNTNRIFPFSGSYVLTAIRFKWGACVLPRIFQFQDS